MLAKSEFRIKCLLPTCSDYPLESSPFLFFGWSWLREHMTSVWQWLRSREGATPITCAMKSGSSLCQASWSCATTCHGSSTIALTVASTASSQPHLPSKRCPLTNLFAGPAAPAWSRCAGFRHHASRQFKTCEIHLSGQCSASRAACPARRHHEALVAWSQREMPLCFWREIVSRHRPNSCKNWTKNSLIWSRIANSSRFWSNVGGTVA